MNRLRLCSAVLAVVGLAVLTGCAAEGGENTPTPDSKILTAEALLTENAESTPESTPTQTATLTLTPLATDLPTEERGGPIFPSGNDYTVGAGVTTLCDMAGFVADLTIPDGTEIQAGETFTKTWQLRNDGTCTWTTEYSVIFYYGSQMSGPDSDAFTDSSIAPGGTVDVSVDLTAPTETGTAIGYWMLQNSSGQTFGLGSAGEPFFVEILVVEADSTSTPTSTPTYTATSDTDTEEATEIPTAEEPTSTATATLEATQEPEEDPTEVGDGEEEESDPDPTEEVVEDPTAEPTASE